MKHIRTALAASLTATALGAAILATRPAWAQDNRNQTPVSADGTYSATHVDGNLQAALDAALAKADLAAAYGPGGAQISDAMYGWQLVSVTGTRGGILGKRDVTVKIQMLK